MTRTSRTRPGLSNGRLLRPLRRLRALIPDLPANPANRGGLVVPQAVVLRPGARGQEVLLVLRTSPRAWELPGGEHEPGEDTAQSAVREVLEETGLEVKTDRLVGWYRRTGFIPHRSPVYACSVVGGRLRGNFESVRLEWFSIDALPAGLFPWYRPAIQAAASGVTLDAEQVQHLGVREVLRAALIHLRGVLGMAVAVAAVVVP